MRYLKQIKQRNTHQVYGSTNVCICEINKPSNFLQYQFAGHGVEADHLRKPKRSPNTGEHTGQILELRAEGKTLREIGAQLGMSFQKVDRIIKASQVEAALVNPS